MESDPTLQFVKWNKLVIFRYFDNNRQLNAYAGIDICRYQSGKTFYKDKINKRGNKHLRNRHRRLGYNHIVEYYEKF
ncbi:transposase [Cytobacillus firmus]|uniref:transposase n=1 Tax=Cytobacillus firmus TaxID=1399 RepID=UPI0009F985E2